MKMRKNLLAMLLAVVMIAAVVFIAAPTAKAADATVIEASAANVEGATDFAPIDVTANSTVDLKGIQGVVINVAEGCTVSLIDTKNVDDLTGNSAGTAKVTGAVANWVQHAGGFKYLALVNDDGTYSAHPFNITIDQYGVNTHYSAISARVTVIANDKVAALIDAGEFGLHNYNLANTENADKEYSPHWYTFEKEDGTFTHGLHGYFYLENSLTSDVLSENASCKLGAYVKINGEIIDSLTILEVTPKAILTDLNKNAKTFNADKHEKMQSMMDTLSYLKDYCVNFLPADSQLTIKQANTMGGTYEHDTTSTNKYYVEGTITEVNNTQYGNVYITDEDGNTFYVYGIYSADGNTRYDAMSIKPVAGDKVKLYGVIGNYNGAQMKSSWLIDFEVGHEHQNSTATCEKAAACTLCGLVSGEPLGHKDENNDHTCDNNCGVYQGVHEDKDGDTLCDYGCAVKIEGNEPPIVKPVDLTLTFDANKANRIEFSTSKQVWEQNGIIFTNNKASSTTNVADYGNPVRLYKSSTITITASGMTKIVFTSDGGSDYKTALQTTLTNAGYTYTNSGNTYTITFAETDSITISLTGGQVRLMSITVTAAPPCEHEGGEATCTERAICDKCGKAYGETAEHAWGDPVVDDASCTEAGSSTKTCSVCGEIEKTTIPATGHNFVDGTCTVCDTAESTNKSWQIATSIKVGDVVRLVCDSKKMELSGISTTSTKYGTGVSYSGVPAGKMELTVVAGSTSGTYAFKTEDGKYLYWSSGNSLATNGTLNANTSWNVTFSSGNAVITNAKDSSRKLQWNASNPRFACYTSAQTAIQLYVYK